MNLDFIPTIEQEQIFSFFHKNNKNGIIDAVAGSGKTTTLVNGIKFISPRSKILFCAFNRKIKTEIDIKTRSFNNVVVKTTYALGLNILRDNNKVFQNARIVEDKYIKILARYLDKTPINDSKQTLIQDAFNKLKDKFDDIKKKEKESKTNENNALANEYINKDEELTFYEIADRNFKQLISLVRLTLSYGKDEEGIRKIAEFYGLDINLNDFEEIKFYNIIIKNVISKGIEESLKTGEIDYSDMIFLPDYFKFDSNYKYDVIFVDECQDLSNAQLKIVLKFYNKNGGRIFAVGDPYQSIYGFAGASPESFNNIKKIILPETFKLTNCFRSSKSIVALAQEIRADINTNNQNVGNVQKIEYNQLFDFTKAGDLVLSRFNKDIVFTFFKLLKNGQSCKILGKEEIIQDIIEFIPKNRHQNKEFYVNLEYQAENIFKAYEKKFKDNEEKIMKYEGIKDIIIFCFYEFHNVTTFSELIIQLRNFLDKDEKDSITLSSIHKSKGLEYDTVFILNYPLLPYKPSKGIQKEWQSYQENCLKYVAITRAKNNLYLVNEDKNEQDVSSLLKMKYLVEDYIETNNILFDDIEDLPL